MNDSRATIALTATIGVLIIGGIAAVVSGGYAGIALLGVAAVIAVTQRTSIARIVRSPDSGRRHRRLILAAILGAVSLAVLIVGFADLGNNDHWDNTRLVVYNIVFLASAITALSLLVIGLLTPATPLDRTAEPAR